MTSTGRQLDLELHLLDRQIVDRDGRRICNVDDLELEIGADGHPYVTGILVGSRALGQRMRGRIGHWIYAISARLADTDELPRIGFEHVTGIGEDITVSRSRDELRIDPLERWVNDNVITRIPGSRHESK